MYKDIKQHFEYLNFMLMNGQISQYNYSRKIDELNEVLKGRVHKYIRREGVKGNYRYIYKENNPVILFLKNPNVELHYDVYYVKDDKGEVVKEVPKDKVTDLLSKELKKKINANEKLAKLLKDKKISFIDYRGHEGLIRVGVGKESVIEINDSNLSGPNFPNIVLFSKQLYGEKTKQEKEQKKKPILKEDIKIPKWAESLEQPKWLINFLLNAEKHPIEINGENYSPVYFVEWADISLSMDPEVEEYDSLKEAYEAAQEPGSEYYSAYGEHTKTVNLYFRKESDETLLSPYDLNKEGVDLPISNNILYIKSFGFREENASELLREVSSEIGKDLNGMEIEAYGESYYLETSKKNLKYRQVYVYDVDDNEVGSFKLRIADHAYNPNNNDVNEREGRFISIEIANKNETENRFHGRYSLKYNGEDTYEKILSDTINRIKEIIEDMV